MIGIAAKMAALMLAIASPARLPVPHASLPIQEAGAKAGECLGLEPGTARQLSGALKANPDLPNSEIAFWNHFHLVQATATSCGMVQGVSVVSVRQNTALTAAIPVRNSETGANATCLLVYLGPVANGEHLFLFLLVPEDADEAPTASPL